jgi:hypothetical protein
MTQKHYIVCYIPGNSLFKTIVSTGYRLFLTDISPQKY